MSFFSTKTDIEDESAGILYILYIRLEDGTEVQKIGVTQRPKIQERVVEILASFFMSFRYFPYCYPKRFKTTSDVYKKEAMMHTYYKEYSHEFEKRFGGSTEFFTIEDLDDLLSVYARVLDGEDVNVPQDNDNGG